MAERVEDPPATIEQLAAAMAALGLYTGANTAAEHAAEAARLGGVEAYRMRLANCLLGGVQVEVLRQEAAPVTDSQRQAAYADQLATAGVEGDPVKTMEFLRWQVLRAATPLREIAQNPQAGPVPLAAAHAAEALQRMLGATASGQALTLDAVAGLPEELREARQALANAISNLDLFLDLIAGLVDT